MQEMSGLLLQILGLACFGFVAWDTIKKLSIVFPYGSPLRWWWTKYLPLLGFGLMLIAINQPLMAMLPGAAIIFGCMVWAEYLKDKKLVSSGDHM